MSENLKQTAMSGMMWGFISQFSMRFVTFVVGIILARLLSPSDYGLIAMTAIFTEISSIIVDSGFSTAIIREKRTYGDGLFHGVYNECAYFNCRLCAFVRMFW